VCDRLSSLLVIFWAYLLTAINLHYDVALFQIGSVKVLISVDFDKSSMEQTDEIAEYLSAVDDVLTYYNENGEVKNVSVERLCFHCLVGV